MGQTGWVASKYDEYWRRTLTQLTDVLDVAASLGSSRLGVAGLRDLYRGHIAVKAIRQRQAPRPIYAR